MLGANLGLLLYGDVSVMHSTNLKKGFRQHSFCIRCIDPWNRLSQTVIDSKTVNEFKTRLDKEWRNDYFKVDEVY